MKLYENLGFVRDKRLFRYYLNGVDALRLKLWLRWDWRQGMAPPTWKRLLHAMQFVQNCFAGGFSNSHAAVTCQCPLSVAQYLLHFGMAHLFWIKWDCFKLQGFFWYQQDVPVNSQDLFICKVCWQCYLHSDHFITEPVSGTWFLFLKEANVVSLLSILTFHTNLP